jgi:hypothetical protein
VISYVNQHGACAGAEREPTSRKSEFKVKRHGIGLPCASGGLALTVYLHALAMELCKVWSRVIDYRNLAAHRVAMRIK